MNKSAIEEELRQNLMKSLRAAPLKKRREIRTVFENIPEQQW